MSDLSIYELDDIIWDDFDRSGDHIVPHPNEDHHSEDKYEGSVCKKPRREITPVQDNKGKHYASGSVSQERESNTIAEGRNTKENESSSHTPDGVFTTSRDADSAKEMPTLQSNDNKLCVDERIVNNPFGAVDSNSYSCPPSHISQSGDLNLFSNDGNAKQSNDSIYYGWPDIGTFEDVDTMLSNCDSSFGLGVTANDDELVWFQSEDPNGEYEEAFKMDLKFPCAEPSTLTNVLDDHEPRESESKRSSFVCESKDVPKIKDQKEQSQHLKSNDIQMSLSDESDQAFTSAGNWQQNENLGHNSVGYIQSTSYLYPAHDNVPVQTNDGSVMTGIKYENTGSASGSQNESSGGIQPSFSGNYKQPGMMPQASRSDTMSRNILVSPHKQFGKENKIESQSDMEGVKKGASGVLDSLNAPEGSSISTELDEISIEASSFRQLQQVMEQLDLRTKLCIRDSLYRLARSAEQRHNYAGMSGSTTNCGATGGPLMSEGTNKYAGLMDMETDTNPIDRTIAHLLFHRPSEASNRATPLPVKPNAKVHGSTIGSTVVAEKQSCQETGNESEDKISSTGKN
uniref:protein LNK1-like n=1 Tax=Erigeron canadensis TaxID=72917 RepID=UPI001CB94838|nr:protein LNK1-like [Erigeron canadensis]